MEWLTRKINMLYGLSLCLSIFSLPVQADKTNIEKNGSLLLGTISLSGLAASLLYEKGSEGALQLSKAMATSLAITGGLKLVTHKKRPNGEDYQAFPSGHTSTAFTGAGFIHKRYGLKYAIPAYIGASYVGYSRIKADKHDAVDVAGGVAIGILSSFYFTCAYQKNMTIMPLVSKESYGVSFNKIW